MKKYNPIVFLLLTLLLGYPKAGCTQEALSVVRQMISFTRSIRSVQFTLDSKERINNRMYHEISTWKINSSPYKIYGKQSYPLKNREILYVTGINEGKVKINPGSFPWVTMNLHPESPLVFNTHHHSVLEAGFVYLSSVIEKFIPENASEMDQILKSISKVKMNDLECYAIILTSPDYRITEYTVTMTETPLTLARKLGINMYSILENNPGLKITEKINPGTKLSIPSDYGSKMELYINLDQLYPVKVKVYDQAGLFEEYTFTQVVINPVFDNIVFSPDHPEYGF